MNTVYNSAEQLIGATPMLRLNRIKKVCNLQADIYAKLESFNLTGSAKDRIALNIINTAEQDGSLKAGGTVIEPTSGNTGIGLAAICAMRGYRLIIVMPDTMSKERQTMMKAYGAGLILTPGNDGMAGSIKKAEELQKQLPGSIIAGQFTNPANPAAHYATTGPEIYNALKRVDILVAGIGTGGTITGTGKYLKQKAGTRIIGVEPATSAVINGRPAGKHGLQGIGAGFIPQTLDLSIIDETVTETEADAYNAARLMGKTEGVLIGISGGAALHTAVELAKKAENAGKNIVVLLPDGGDRYFSTELYE